MDWIAQLFDFVLHVDKHLGAFVADYGAWVYALLFLIVFVETGVVVMPFLPGDSLLFITGALAGAGLIDLSLACLALLAAAIAGMCMGGSKMRQIKSPRICHRRWQRFSDDLPSAIFGAWHVVFSLAPTVFSTP